MRTARGGGRKSGLISSSAVTAVHAKDKPANTAAAMLTNSAAEIGLPSLLDRRTLCRTRGSPPPAFASGGGGIHESAVDQLGKVHVLGQDAGLEGGSLHLRHHLAEE